MPRYENTGSHPLRFASGPEPVPGEIFEHDIPPDQERFLIGIHAIRRVDNPEPTDTATPARPAVQDSEKE